MLSSLIIITFFAVMYGIYTKIYPKTQKNNSINEIVSLSLTQGQEIKDMQVINNNRILITIVDDNGTQGIIFDIDSQKIIQKINK